MYFEFRNSGQDVISQNENRAELIRDVRVYYKGLAIDRENEEFEVIGTIVTLNQFDEEINIEQYYATGCMPVKSSSPYLQSEFI